MKSWKREKSEDLEYLAVINCEILEYLAVINYEDLEIMRIFAAINYWKHGRVQNIQTQDIQ
jgi:hypothetical protein